MRIFQPTVTGSLITTGSNTFIGSQVISGGLFVYNTVTNNNSLDTLNRALISSDGITGVSWGSRVLTGNDGREAIKWGDSRELIDTSRLTSVEWEGRILYANDGTTAHLDWSNPSYMQLGGITESPIVNVLGIDGGGRLYYTASSAIGGGGTGGDFVPSSWTGSAASQFAGTASFVLSSSRAINALTASRLNADNTSIFGSGNRMTITASNGLIINAGNPGVDLQSKITVTGDILPGGTITNNTSSYSLGSPTAAWKDLYVSNGSINFVGPSGVEASITYDSSSDSINFSGANVTGVFNSTSSVLGNGLSSSFNINHGFNTRNLHITVYDSASGDIVYPDLKHINANTSSIIFANPPSLNQYIVYISQ